MKKLSQFDFIKKNSEAIHYLKKNNLAESRIDLCFAVLNGFLAKENAVPIPENQLDKLIKKLAVLNKNIKWTICHLLFDKLLASAEKKQFATERKELIKNFKQGKDAKIIDQIKTGSKKIFFQLGVLLNNEEMDNLFEYGFTTKFPKIHNSNKPVLVRHLLNTNILIYLSKPKYLLYTTAVEKKASSLNVAGVRKKRSNYIVIESHKKIYKGDRGDNTYLMLRIRDRKLYFFRNILPATWSAFPCSVIASKFARLISPIHFSSEHAFKSGITFSTHFARYQVSYASERYKEKRILYQKRNLVPGAAIIDAVSFFIQENDANCENLGFFTGSEDVTKVNFSEKNDFQIHLVKIDFDCCRLNVPYIEKESVSSNQFSITANQRFQPANLIPHPGGFKMEHLPFKWVFKKDLRYIQERLTAKLKIALIPNFLLHALINKYHSTQDRDFEQAYKNLLQGRKFAEEEVLNKSQHGISITQKDIEHLSAQLENYIDSHFPETSATLLKGKLAKRKATILKKVITCTMNKGEQVELCSEKYLSYPLINKNSKEKSKKENPIRNPIRNLYAWNVSNELSHKKSISNIINTQLQRLKKKKPVSTDNNTNSINTQKYTFFRKLDTYINSGKKEISTKNLQNKIDTMLEKPKYKKVKSGIFSKKSKNAIKKINQEINKATKKQV